MLASLGVPWLYFPLAVGLLALFVLSIYYLFRPAPAGLAVCLATLAAGAALTVFYGLLTLNNLAETREAYATGREARGLSVRPGALDMVFSPQGIVTSCAIAVALAGVAGYLLMRNATYFSWGDDREG